MVIEHSKLDAVVTNFIQNIDDLPPRKLLDAIEEYLSDEDREFEEADIEYMADEFAKYTRTEFIETYHTADNMNLKELQESEDSEDGESSDDDLFSMVS